MSAPRELEVRGGENGQRRNPQGEPGTGHRPRRAGGTGARGGRGAPGSQAVRPQSRASAPDCRQSPEHKGARLQASPRVCGRAGPRT